jgi:hypothetical protein
MFCSKGQGLDDSAGVGHLVGSTTAGSDKSLASGEGESACLVVSIHLTAVKTKHSRKMLFHNKNLARIHGTGSRKASMMGFRYVPGT